MWPVKWSGVRVVLKSGIAEVSVDMNDHPRTPKLWRALLVLLAPHSCLHQFLWTLFYILWLIEIGHLSTFCWLSKHTYRLTQFQYILPEKELWVQSTAWILRTWLVLHSVEECCLSSILMNVINRCPANKYKCLLVQGRQAWSKVGEKYCLVDVYTVLISKQVELPLLVISK